MEEWLSIYLVTFFISLICGLIFSSDTDSYYRKASCNKPIAKIEYIIPGFQVGCWLGKPWSEDEKKD